MKKEVLKRAVIGFFLGMLIGNFISYISSGRSAVPPVLVSDDLIRKAGSEMAALIVQTVLSGILGAVSFMGTIFYDLDDWGMTKTMLVHFLLILGVYFPVGFYCGWIEPDLKYILMVTGAMAFAYLIVWVIMYIRYRIETARLNQLVKQQHPENQSKKTK